MNNKMKGVSTHSRDPKTLSSLASLRNYLTHKTIDRRSSDIDKH